MGELPRMNEEQSRRARQLIRRLCANHDGGYCLLLDDGDACVCPQSITNALVCRYFKAAVLPADGGARRKSKACFFALEYKIITPAVFVSWNR